MPLYKNKTAFWAVMTTLHHWSVAMAACVIGISLTFGGKGKYTQGQIEVKHFHINVFLSSTKGVKSLTNLIYII